MPRAHDRSACVALCARLQLQVTLLRDGQPVHQNSHSVVLETPSARTPELLKARAYRMLNAAVADVLGDLAFKRAFLGASI